MFEALYNHYFNLITVLMSHHDMCQNDHLTGVILNTSLLSFTIICLTKFIIKLFIAQKEPNLITINIQVSPHYILLSPHDTHNYCLVPTGHHGAHHVGTFMEHLENKTTIMLFMYNIIVNVFITVPFDNNSQ